jgi:uncharacterized protein (DUF305 family)
MKTFLALPAALVVLALAAGCGSDDDGRRSAPGNATDAAFITDMTPHHESAVAMANLAREQAEHPEIRALADDIVATQEGEVSMMRTIRRDMEHVGGEDQNAGQMGMSDRDMGTDVDPAQLDGAKPFDRVFIDLMVPHHAVAIAMAREQLAKGIQPALKEMAEAIIDAQSTEIARLKKWRKRWYGSGEVPSSRDHHADDAH